MTTTTRIENIALTIFFSIFFASAIWFGYTMWQLKNSNYSGCMRVPETTQKEDYRGEIYG